jgi:hypothetical protein
MSAEDRDTTVVIPSTGHLAIKPSGNFTGPAGVIQTGNQTYDLTGHKATANQRGLLINNGKKYIAK